MNGAKNQDDWERLMEVIEVAVRGDHLDEAARAALERLVSFQERRKAT